MDDDMAKYPGLVQRDGVWLVRKRIPVDLQHIDTRGSVRVSLGTKDKREAIRLYPLKLAEIQAGFDRMREELRSKPFVDVALATGRIEDLGRAELEDIVRGWWKARSAPDQPEQDDFDADDDALDVLQRDASERERDGTVAADVTDQLLVEAGVASKPHRVGRIKTQVLYPAIDRDNLAYNTLRSLVSEGLRYEVMLTHDRLTGERTALPHPIFNPDGAATSDGSHRVGDLIGAFRAEREKLRGVESTARKYGLLFRVMEEFWGADLPVREVSRQRCVDLVSFLESLPANGTKKFPKLTLTQSVAACSAGNHKRLAPNTVATYVQNLCALLRWGKLHGFGVTVNTEGLKPKAGAEVERRGMTPDELTLIFRSLAIHREDAPHKLWIPALAAYTGARAEELCQLRTEDVTEIDGIACLNLTRFDPAGRAIKGKRFKNRQSERIVPIHDELLKAGFAEFAANGDSQGRLFPSLKAGPKGNFSHNFSKWFGRFMDRIELSDPSLVFHSFRHGFRDACRMAEILEETAHALGGWATVNQGQRYGNRSAVPLLHRALKKVTYGQFSLAKVLNEATQKTT